MSAELFKLLTLYKLIFQKCLHIKRTKLLIFVQLF